MTTHDSYTVVVGGESFETPLRSLGSVRIAYLDFLCDIQLVRACVRELAELLPVRSGAIVVPATGAIPLGFELAALLGRPLVVLRKGRRGYMSPSLSVPVRSIAAEESETLLVETGYLAALRHNPVTLLDTVSSTGSTLRAMRELMAVAGVDVAEAAVAFIEGDLPSADILSLGRLPVFPEP